MTDQECRELLEDLFPVGKERWVKVKYLDFEKSHKAFRIFAKDEINEELGYEVRALGIRDEHTPQIATIMDIRDEIYPLLLRKLDESSMDLVHKAFSSNLKKLKECTIKTVEQLFDNQEVTNEK